VMESEDGRAVGVHRNTGERNGKRLDVLCCIVFDIRNGKVMAESTSTTSTPGTRSGPSLVGDPDRHANRPGSGRGESV
jgi:hypothetical protein